MFLQTMQTLSVSAVGPYHLFISEQAYPRLLFISFHFTLFYLFVDQGMKQYIESLSVGKNDPEEKTNEVTRSLRREGFGCLSTLRRTKQNKI